MYYTGYQLGVKYRFSIFSGIATSDDGIIFNKYSTVPVMERKSGEEIFRSIQCVLKDEAHWKIYYVAGNEFRETSLGKKVPFYELYCMETTDLFNLNKPDCC